MPDGTLLLTGSGRLCLATPEGATAPGVLTPWAVLIADGRIRWLGPPREAPGADTEIHLGEALITPGLVDSHTHAVFAGDRSDEAAARLAGAPYRAGGILRTVAATRAAADEELLAAVERRFQAQLAAGATTVEAKSGYGLSLDEELRALRLIGEAAGRVGLRVRRTLLAAHAVPPEAAGLAEYAEHVAREVIPAAAVARLADFCDVFCDDGFFDLASTERILSSAIRHGLGVRLHAEQLARTGAAELGVRLGAASVDHLERLDARGIGVLARSKTVAALLPGPAVVMRGPLPPARALLDAGATVALASDANAGTFGAWGAMPLVIGLGATILGMTVDESLAAATAGGAAALRLDGELGTFRPGAAADLVAWDAEHEGAFALHLGAVRPARVWIGGREVAPAARPGLG